LARVVGFPEELWEADPCAWEVILDREGVRLDPAGRAILHDRRNYYSLHARMRRLSPEARAEVEAMIDSLVADGT
jgi:hypothetical protein